MNNMTVCSGARVVSHPFLSAYIGPQTQQVAVRGFIRTVFGSVGLAARLVDEPCEPGGVGPGQRGRYGLLHCS